MSREAFRMHIDTHVLSCIVHRMLNKRVDMCVDLFITYACHVCVLSQSIVKVQAWYRGFKSRKTTRLRRAIGMVMNRTVIRTKIAGKLLGMRRRARQKLSIKEVWCLIRIKECQCMLLWFYFKLLGLFKLIVLRVGGWAGPNQNFCLLFQ